MNNKTIKPATYSSEFAKPISVIAVALTCLLALATFAPAGAASPVDAKTFPTPQAAADALINAAENFDVPALEQILGPGGEEIIHTGEPARDKEIAKQFAEQA